MIKIVHCGFVIVQGDRILFYLMNEKNKKTNKQRLCLPGLLITDLKLKSIASQLVQMLYQISTCVYCDNIFTDMIYM